TSSRPTSSSSSSRPSPGWRRCTRERPDPCRHHPPARDQREVDRRLHARRSQCERRQQVHVRGSPRRQQDPDQGGDRGSLRQGEGHRRQRQRPDDEGQGEAPRYPSRPDPRLHDPVAQGDRHPGPRPEDRVLRGGLTMPLRSYKATSPGLRQMTRSTFEEITTDKPYKPLLEAQIRGSGRNNAGRLSVRHRGGGEKQHYRKIDFKRDKLGIPARLATIEYDPNRSARIGLLFYRDGEKRYMLLP